MRHKIAIVMALAALALLYGCQGQPPIEQPAEPRCATFSNMLGSKLEDASQTIFSQALDKCFRSAYGTYVRARAIEVEPAVRDTSSFGPWTADKEYLTTDASKDGRLTEWYDNYYITHDWSSCGQQILELIPGDSVVVNGRTLHVEGIYNYPKDSYYDEVIELVGPDKTVLQTCYPDSEYNRIVYGS